MRVFVAGATGVIGQYLVPGLIGAGHEVTASTRSPLKANQLKGQGAVPEYQALGDPRRHGLLEVLDRRQGPGRPRQRVRVQGVLLGLDRAS